MAGSGTIHIKIDGRTRNGFTWLKYYIIIMSKTAMGKTQLRYEDTLKADSVEEWIAKVFLRPIVFRIVVLLYKTKIHSVHVTLGFLLIGIVAA